MNWENHFYEKQIKKTKNQCQNAASEKKPLARNVNLILRKSSPRMNYEWIEITIPIKKIEKTAKI